MFQKRTCTWRWHEW
jgi:Glycosyl hydrolase catalytic core.